MTSQERLILKGCKSHNRLAQGQLYAMYKPVVLSICLRYLRDPDEAKDVHHDVFLKIFGKIRLFKEEGSFEGWIRRLTVNHCLSLLRKKRFVIEEELDDERQPLEEEPTETLYSSDQLKKALDALPMPYYTVFVLYSLDGYPHEEIAEKLGIKVGTSRSRVHRARVLLQEELKKMTL